MCLDFELIPFSKYPGDASHHLGKWKCCTYSYTNVILYTNTKVEQPFTVQYHYDSKLMMCNNSVVCVYVFVWSACMCTRDCGLLYCSVDLLRCNSACGQKHERINTKTTHTHTHAYKWANVKKRRKKETNKQTNTK